MHSLLSQLPMLAAVLSFAAAQSLPSFSNIASSCADSAGFTSCWNNATSVAQNCLSDSANKCSGSGACTSEDNCSSSRPACVDECVCPAYSDMLNCALSHCWNAVYSCEYQNLAIEAVRNCAGAGRGPRNTWDADGYVPFAPAPSNLTATGGSCSCDITFVLYRHAAARDVGDACAARVSNGTLGLKGVTADDCACCAASESVSSYYATCPGTAPGAVPYWNATIADALAVLQSETCVTALSASGGLDCRALGFGKPGYGGTASFLNSSSVPANGTATLSDVSGSSSITSPLSGPTLVWRLGSDPKFAQMTAVAASATTTATATGSSSASATSSGATTGATSSAAAASKDMVSGGLLVWQLGAVLVGMALM